MYKEPSTNTGFERLYIFIIWTAGRFLGSGASAQSMALCDAVQCSAGTANPAQPKAKLDLYNSSIDIGETRSRCDSQ